MKQQDVATSLRALRRHANCRGMEMRLMTRCVFSPSDGSQWQGRRINADMLKVSVVRARHRSRGGVHVRLQERGTASIGQPNQAPCRCEARTRPIGAAS
jgi:hypothetical protein